MKQQRIAIMAIVSSVLFSYILLVAGKYGYLSFFHSRLSQLLPLVVGCIVGFSLILGTIYLYKTGKLRREHLTYPVYGSSALLEALGDTIGGSLGLALNVLGFVALLIAVAIDIRKKIGLYRFFSGYRGQ
jgi:hypothetical protein